MRRWKRFVENGIIVGASAVLLGYIGLLLSGVPAKEIPSYLSDKAQQIAQIAGENLCRFQNPLYDMIVYGNKKEQENATWITILWEAQSPGALYQANQAEEVESELVEPEYLYANETSEQESVVAESEEENLEESQIAEAPQETSIAAETTQSQVAAGEEMPVVVDTVTMPGSVTLVPATGVLNAKLNCVIEKGIFSAEQLFDYNTMLTQMCVVNPGCGAGIDMWNPAVLLTKDLSISKESEGPQILIYHTHSQEAFVDSTPGDVSQTIVGAGEYLTQILTEQYGYQVLHHTGQYDVDENGNLDRDPAYNRALPVLEQILAENPSIQVIIDLHRDGVADNVHLVTEVDGKQVARVMFFNGTCRDEAGDIEGMVNPYREDNLAFSLQMALLMKAQYNDMFRVVYLKQSRYNQHLLGRSALIEVGAQTNTVEEIYNAIPYVAEVIDEVLCQ